MKRFTLLLFLFVGNQLFSQSDSTKKVEEEEDYSIYENVTSTDGQNKTFCNPKIFDLSPSRFISIAWDQQLPYDMKFSQMGYYPKGSNVSTETTNVIRTSGIRLFANIPVISSNKFLWQLGLNYWNMKYVFSENTTPNTSLVQQLQNFGLTTMGLHSTVYKPLNDKQFILMQVSADLSGNYTISNIQDLKFTRYSASILWGKRPNDRKQWAIGLSRTYRVGELNFLPIILYNWTAPNRKWGTEILCM